MPALPWTRRSPPPGCDTPEGRRQHPNPPPLPPGPPGRTEGSRGRGGCGERRPPAPRRPGAEPPAGREPPRRVWFELRLPGQPGWGPPPAQRPPQPSAPARLGTAAIPCGSPSKRGAGAVLPARPGPPCPAALVPHPAPLRTRASPPHVRRARPAPSAHRDSSLEAKGHQPHGHHVYHPSSSPGLGSAQPAPASRRLQRRSCSAPLRIV